MFPQSMIHRTSVVRVYQTVIPPFCALVLVWYARNGQAQGRLSQTVYGAGRCNTMHEVMKRAQQARPRVMPHARRLSALTARIECERIGRQGAPAEQLINILSAAGLVGQVGVEPVGALLGLA